MKRTVKGVIQAIEYYILDTGSRGTRMRLVLPERYFQSDWPFLLGHSAGHSRRIE